jgi:predicted O-methyltransferase YrrM
MDATRQTFLDELYAHGRAHDEQREDRLQRLRNVEPETAELLGVLVRAMSATRVLEVGTSNGYSTIWLADAAEAVGGSVISLELEPDRTAQAASNLSEAGVKAFVELRTQDAAEALAAFADDAFDLIFLDAERPLYAGYWPDLIRILRPNGLLVVDNTLSHAKELVEFSELVYASEQVTSTLVTVGAGVLLIVKST